MRARTLVAVGLFVGLGCAGASPEPPPPAPAKAPVELERLEALPSDWVEVAEIGGRLHRVEGYCDANAKTISIGETSMHVMLGQEEIDISLAGAARRGERIVFGENKQYSFAWVERERGLGRWDLGGWEPVLLATVESAARLPVWSDTDCPEP